MNLLSISAPTGEEAPVRDYILGELTRLGVRESEIRVDDAPSRIALPCQTGNLIVQAGGDKPGPRRLLLAHMDTVPLARNADPEVRGDRIVALGRTALGGDDRAGVAAILTAFEELKRLDLPHPPLTLLFTVREESGLRGAAAVRLEDLGPTVPACAFNFDGGCPNEATIGATGSMRLEIEIRGIAAHAGAHPEKGVSAIAAFAAAVVDLERGGWLGLIQRPEGSGTSNIGVVQAGEATNVITDGLHARAEARSHEPRFLDKIVAEFRRAFMEAAAAHRNKAGRAAEVDVCAERSYSSFRLPQESPAVVAALNAARAAGLQPSTRVSNGGLDANWLTHRGVPTVSLGCGQHEIHTVEEYVLIEEYLAACRVALALMEA